MANGLYLITYVDEKGRLAIIKLDQTFVREISELRHVARHGLCLLQGARAAHNEPFGMATKRPERRQGQGCGRSPHPKGLALMVPEWRVASARCRRVSDKNATNNHQKT